VRFTEALNGSGANATAFGDDGLMPRLVPVEELFKGRHFDREIDRGLVRPQVSEL
jgi:hypothetical protein